MDANHKKDVERRMKGAVDSLITEYMGLRAGRAHPSLLEGLEVEVYESKVRLDSIASVSAPETRMLTVSVWDNSLVPAVERAVRESSLGLNPKVEGGVLRIPVPSLSEERRKELCKVAQKYAEQARIAVRNIRRDALDKVKRQEKAGEIGKDMAKRESNSIQSLTDQHIESIDQALARKDSEILQV